MSTGVKIEQAAVEAYFELQKNALHKFVVMGFNDKLNAVELKNVGAKGSTFDDLIKVVPKDHVRYIAYDCEYTLVGGGERSKVLIVSWSSDDDAPAREKMLVSGTKNEVNSKCKSFVKSICINDWSEMTEEYFIDSVSDNKTK